MLFGFFNTLCSSTAKNMSQLYIFTTQKSLTHVVGSAILELQTEVVGTCIGVIKWIQGLKTLMKKKETK